MFKWLKKLWSSEKKEPTEFEVWAFGKPVPNRNIDKIERWNERHGNKMTIGNSSSFDDCMIMMKCIYYKQVIKNQENVDI